MSESKTKAIKSFLLSSRKKTKSIHLTFKQHLQIYIYHQQNDWEKFFPLDKFPHYNLRHSSINLGFFFINCQFYLQFNITRNCNFVSIVLDANKNIAIYKATLDILVQKVIEAKNVQVYYYDHNHKLKQFFSNDKVWLIFKNIKT